VTDIQKKTKLLNFQGKSFIVKCFRCELMEYQDFITYEPEQICIVKEQFKFDLVTDPKYTHILIALRERPLPIKDLVDEYNKIADKPRKQTSIYNYLQELIKQGLVMKAGQRVITGKTASEVLYSRRAILYYPVILSEDFWKTEESKNVLEKCQQLLSLYTDSEPFKIDDLSSFFMNIYSKSEVIVAEIFEKDPDSVNKLCSDLDFEQIDKLTRMLETLVILLNPQNYVESLKELKMLDNIKR